VGRSLIISVGRTGAAVTVFIFLITGLLSLQCNLQSDETGITMTQPDQPIKLPEPQTKGKISLEENLQNRRSVRDYIAEPLTLPEVSQLLWAAQGQTSEWGGRTAPSAGALYPLETYLVAGNVSDLPSGIYRYNPEKHELLIIKDGDFRERLADASLGQGSVREGAINIVISAIYERTTGKYGDRGIRYVHMEAGHAAQNICLQATALNLGAVTIGAFNDNEIKNITGMADNEYPLYVIPVGKTDI